MSDNCTTAKKKLAPPVGKSAISVTPRFISRSAADKITQWDQPKADQSIGPMKVETTANGIDVTANAENLKSSPDFPDGFRWLQTVTTNDPSNTPNGAPLLAFPITYVDPRPNDDTKPFYFTDAEEIAFHGLFWDPPARPTNPTGTVTWDAVLSLGGVNNKEVTRFDSVTYGFSLESNGNLTVNYPKSPSDLSDHIGALTKEFPDWKFKEAGYFQEPQTVKTSLLSK